MPACLLNFTASLHQQGAHFFQLSEVRVKEGMSAVDERAEMTGMIVHMFEFVGLGNV